MCKFKGRIREIYKKFERYLTSNQSQGWDSQFFFKCNKKCLYKPNKLTLVPLCSIYFEKITFNRTAGNLCYLKKSVEYSNMNPKNPQFDFKLDSCVKKLHPPLKKWGRIHARKSVIQEAVILALRLIVVVKLHPAMRLKIIFSRCMEHRGTKLSSLSLYRHFLLHFRKSGDSPPCD